MICRVTDKRLRLSYKLQALSFNQVGSKTPTDCRQLNNAEEVLKLLIESALKEGEILPEVRKFALSS